MCSFIRLYICTYITYFTSLAARIGFVQTGYAVSEDGGPVEFLIGVLEGNLAIDVEVSFATGDGTAIGKIFMLLYTCM